MKAKGHYQIIEKAIQFIRQRLEEQPSLDEISSHVGLSPFHFQRIFSEWAGISPKKFIKFASLSKAKHLLSQKGKGTEATAFEVGLSGSSRLHDLFITLEGMTPGEYSQGGKGLNIEYSFIETIFGRAIIANTGKGICFLMFCEHDEEAWNWLKEAYPNADFRNVSNALHKDAEEAINDSSNQQLRLHVKGTDFQLKVWQALLNIEQGKVKSYGEMAADINQEKASRAVGTAIGSNAIAYLIPCHRVIQAGGEIGNYRWGSNRKIAMLAYEQVKGEHDE
ncbi:MAG TPA: methylated-DNA--[protein]-cysteine S-methyltransferase [Bacteroidia bacterium]